MGCGNSLLDTNHSKKGIARQSSFKSSTNKPKDSNKISIEDARKRREEGAKQRTRRASVMGMLEAEKLKQRKLSNASVQNIPVPCEAEEPIKDHFDIDKDSSSDNANDQKEIRNESRNENRNNTINEDKNHSKNSHKAIQIIISPDTRSNSAETVNS